MFHNLKYLTLVLLLAFPLVAEAQQRSRPQQQRAQTPRAEALSRPKALGQILLPAGARRVPTGRLEAPRDGWHRWPQTDRSWWKQQRRSGHYPFGSFYAVPYVGGGYAFDTAPAEERYVASAREHAAPATNKGVLQLQITPASGLDYYVDGAYIGSSSTLGSEFEVNAGARQVEVRARGYKPATFDTRINEGDVTTVRGSLEAIAQPQAPVGSGSRVMYVIPGCYMGNAKPDASTLPPGCDIRRMVTRGTGL